MHIFKNFTALLLTLILIVNFNLPIYANETSSERLIEETTMRSLSVSDNLSYEQLIDLIENCPSIGQESLYKSGNFAEVLYLLQENYGVSALGILAISATESAWGTSNMAHQKNNFFGWGAYTDDPSQAIDYSNIEPYEAFYKVSELIINNYIKNGQNCYYTMRNNNDHHQYCTSKTWVKTNAENRLKLEKYFKENQNKNDIKEDITPKVEYKKTQSYYYQNKFKDMYIDTFGVFSKK